jgi:hypothetical protein
MRAYGTGIFDSNALRLEMAARGAWANIKPDARPQTPPAVQRLPLPQPRQTRFSQNLDALYEPMS